VSCFNLGPEVEGFGSFLKLGCFLPMGEGDLVFLLRELVVDVVFCRPKGILAAIQASDDSGISNLTPSCDGAASHFSYRCGGYGNEATSEAAHFCIRNKSSRPMTQHDWLKTNRCRGKMPLSLPFCTNPRMICNMRC
jgi:hypothetical protein